MVLSKPADATDEDEDTDKIKWMERPASQEERELRLLKSLAAFYRVNATYLSDTEAMKLAIQNVGEERNKWAKSNVETETP